MSNRLNVAHLAPRRESHEFFAAPQRAGLADTALRWLSGLADRSEMMLSPRLRQDLGLPAAAAIPLLLLASVLACWGGSFEIHRFFYAGDGTGVADHISSPEEVTKWHYQGTQMGLSLWWGLYAAGMLAVGFLYRRPPLRYAAMAIFAVTIVKVSFVDLEHIEMTYRVLSLMGLGLLLLAGSWLYHRQMRAKS